VTVDAEIMSHTDAAARVFESELGCQIEVVQPAWANPLRHFRTLMAIDSDLRGMRELAAKHQDTMSVNLSQFLANEWSAESMTDAVKARKAYCNMIWPLFERFDFLLTPISTNLPPPADKRPGAADFDRPLPVYTCLANMTGQPAAALPVGFTKDGLPVGVQILGDHLADLQVLALAAAFERVRPWKQSWPPQ
jgi:aspartyl-tRNA(Asn)/glutamyl-tRNA(Gln) amidotransferase subunit A